MLCKMISSFQPEASSFSLSFCVCFMFFSYHLNLVNFILTFDDLFSFLPFLFSFFKSTIFVVFLSIIFYNLIVFSVNALANDEKRRM